MKFYAHQIGQVAKSPSRALIRPFHKDNFAPYSWPIKKKITKNVNCQNHSVVTYKPHSIYYDFEKNVINHFYYFHPISSFHLLMRPLLGLDCPDHWLNSLHGRNHAV